MHKIEYYNIPVEVKMGWGGGPWVTEPDKIQWEDEDTKLPCLMVRNAHIIEEKGEVLKIDGEIHLQGTGVWCGYVGVPPDHPAYGRDYGDEFFYDIGAHGGLTYADKCNVARPQCESICHVTEDGEEDDIWWLGFDCGHCDDYMPLLYAKVADLREGEIDNVLFGNTKYRDQAYVEDRCKRLARQLYKVYDKVSRAD